MIIKPYQRLLWLIELFLIALYMHFVFWSEIVVSYWSPNLIDQTEVPVSPVALFWNYLETSVSQARPRHNFHLAMHDLTARYQISGERIHILSLPATFTVYKRKIRYVVP